MVGGKLFLIASLTVVLASCADILPLTGGEEDRFAPKPIRQEPEQASVLFSGNRAVLTFDENMTLADPATTLTMNPSVGKLTTVQKNRTVTVSWDGALQPNTTYILQFNGTIRDIHEGNDSIMQVIFATGTTIDSLGFSGKLVNGFTNQTVSQASVGLYPEGSDPSREKPLYATRSGMGGTFRFGYLKREPYRLVAFVDQNKDQLLQPTELIGFASEAVVPGETDSLVVLLYQPVAEKKQLKADLRFPGLLTVYGKSLDDVQLEVNGTPAQLVRRYSSDSLLLAIPEGTTSSVRIVAATDTIIKPVSARDLQLPLIVRPVVPNQKWRQGDTLFFEVNAANPSLNETAISLINEKGKPVPYTLTTSGNTWAVVPDRSTIEHFTLRYEKAAVSGAGSASDSVTFRYTTLLPADLSKLTVHCPDFEGQWIIELVQGEKTIASVIKQTDRQQVVFDRVEAGQYNLRCVRDTNANGRWDAGSLAEQRQPEQVVRYTLTQKLRANWEIEETLQLKP